MSEDSEKRSPDPQRRAMEAATLTEHGFDALERKDFPKAIEHFTNALRSKGDYYDAIFNRGVAHLMLEDFSKAESDFIQCTKIDPEYGMAWARLAEIQEQMGKIDECLETAAAALQKNQNSRDYFTCAWMRSQILQSRDDKIGAIEALAQAIEKGPFFFEAYDQLIPLLEATGQSDKADDYKKRLAFTKELGKKLEEAAILFDAQKLPEAEAKYSEILALDPKNLEGLFNRGQIRFSSNRFSEAIPDFEQLTLLAPSGAHAFSFLGHCHAALKNKDEARKAFLKVIELEPSAESEIQEYIDALDKT